MRRDRRFWVGLVAIAVAAALVRVLYTVLVDPQVGGLSDASAYHLLARNLAHGLGYIRPFDLERLHLSRPTAEYPPLYPALLSLFDRAGVDGVNAQQAVVGTLLGTATVVLVGLLGKRVAGPTTGLVAAGLAAFYPMLFQTDAILMTETLYALLVTTALLLTYQALDASTPGFVLVAALGAVLGLAALTRTEGLLLAIALLAGLGISARAANVRRRLAITGAGLVIVVLVVAPWTARNAARFHTFVPVSNNLGTVVDGANCDTTYRGSQIGLWRFLPQCFQGFDIRADDFDEARVARSHLREGTDYIDSHTRRVPAVVAVRVLRTFALWPDQVQQMRTEALEGRVVGWQWAGTVMFWALAALAVPGAMSLHRSSRPLWPLAGTFAVVIVTAAITYGNQRFRIGAEPALIVLAAAGAHAIVSRIVRSAP